MIFFIAVGIAEDRAEAAAGAGLCGRGKHIQREADIFEIAAGVIVCGCGGAGFRHAAAQRMDHHIHRTEQLHDGEQADGHIDCHRGTQGCIAAAEGTAAVAAVMRTAGVAAAVWIAQLCCQSNGLAFRYHEGAAVGIAAGELVGGGGHIGFRGAKQGHPQVIHIGGMDVTDEATKWQ